MSYLILNWLIEKSIGLSLLIAVILLLRPVVMRVLNSSIQYRMWLSLPIYLLTPTFQLKGSINSSITFFSSSFNPIQIKSIANNSLDIISILLIIWCFGMLLFTAKFIQQLVLLSRFGTTDSIFSAKKISRNIIVKRADVNSPAIYGIFKPILLLPIGFPDELSQQQINLILEHEKNHWIKKDPVWNILAWWLSKIFWFHPLLMLAYRYFRKDQELACDFEVTKALSNSAKANYGKLLLKQSNVSENGILCHWSGASLVKERMKMLKQHTENRIATWFGLILIGIISTMAVSLNAKENKPEPEPIVVAEPLYPRKAALNGVEGSVTLEFDLDGKGYPQNIKIIQANPTGVFDEASKKSIKQWRFKETNRRSMQYTMQFKLE